MKIDATVKQIRILLRLAERSETADGPGIEDGRKGQEAMQRGLPRSLRERYDSLIEAGRTPAVVAIARGACSGCHLRLPTMVEQMARRSPAVHTCPHCRRLLYAPELLHEDEHAAGGKPSRPSGMPDTRS